MGGAEKIWTAAALGDGDAVIAGLAWTGAAAGCATVAGSDCAAWSVLTADMGTVATMASAASAGRRGISTRKRARECLRAGVTSTVLLIALRHHPIDARRERPDILGIDRRVNPDSDLIASELAVRIDVYDPVAPEDRSQIC